MANQIGDTVSKGHYFNVCTDETNQTFETRYFHTDGEDVEFNDGDDAETKVGAIKGITSDLNTTTEGYAADMTTVAKINSSLKGFEPVLDETGKITGYKTEIGGADTVFPFSGAKKVTISGTVGYYITSAGSWASAATVNLSFEIDGSGNITNISSKSFQTGNIQPNYISVTYGANASTNAKFVVNNISIS